MDNFKAVYKILSTLELNDAPLLAGHSRLMRGSYHEQAVQIHQYALPDITSSTDYIQEVQLQDFYYPTVA